MKSKILATAVCAAVLALTPLTAQARNTPCSGKMGGVKACTSDGKFLCQNGKISQSKKVCR
ncbi:MAG: hypothetical protein VXY56_09225 [Pseudomonadota bacterium]|nr:hypothetical protein [Pseudomonadota bacterium]